MLSAGLTSAVVHAEHDAGGYARDDHEASYDISLDPEDRTAVFDLALKDDSSDGGLLDWETFAGQHKLCSCYQPCMHACMPACLPPCLQHFPHLGLQYSTCENASLCSGSIYNEHACMGACPGYTAVCCATAFVNTPCHACNMQASTATPAAAAIAPACPAAPACRPPGGTVIASASGCSCRAAPTSAALLSWWRAA